MEISRINQEKDQINSSSYKTQLLINLLVFVKWWQVVDDNYL